MEEQLRDINIFRADWLNVDAYQGLLIGLATLAMLVTGYLLLGRLVPWFYNKETTSEANRGRVVNVIRFTLLSVLGIGILQILNIDYIFVDSIIQRPPPTEAGDAPPVYLDIHISTLIRALVVFTIANVLDLLLEEFLQQRYHRQQSEGLTTAEAKQLRQTRNRFAAVAPLMYTLAVGFVAEDTGIADAYVSIQNHIITVGNVISAFFVFFLVRLILLIVTTFVLSGYYRRSRVDVGSQYAINRLLTYFAYLIGILLVIQAAGFNLVVIWTGAAALLVGIGIGLQQTFNDLICGVIILFERSVKVGDVVEIGEQTGTVRKIGTRTSTVETWDDIIIFVPNSKLIGENVINWSHVTRHARFHVLVGVAYGSDTDKVREVLLQVAKDHPKILDSPKALVRFIDFGASSLDFDLLFYVREFRNIENIQSDVRFAIDRAFRQHDIEIPFPQRDLWIRGGEAADRFLGGAPIAIGGEGEKETKDAQP